MTSNEGDWDNDHERKLAEHDQKISEHDHIISEHDQKISKQEKWDDAHAHTDEQREIDQHRRDSRHDQRFSDQDRRFSDQDRRASEQDWRITSDQEEVQRSLGRVEGKLDMLIAAHAKATARCDTCDLRLKKVETDITRAQAFAVAAMALATFLGAERIGRLFHLPV